MDRRFLPGNRAEARLFCWPTLLEGDHKPRWTEDGAADCVPDPLLHKRVLRAQWRRPGSTGAGAMS